MNLVLRARWVFPVSAPPLEGGCVEIEPAGRVAAVGLRLGGSRMVDLGDVALLPGLVNAHTHLELSTFERPLGSPGEPLPAWLRRIVAHGRAADEAEFCAAVERGWQQSADAGTVALGDIGRTSAPARAAPSENAAPAGTNDLVSAVDRTEAAPRGAERPPGGVAFLELIAPTPERAAEVSRLADRYLTEAFALDRPGGPWRKGLSPHAPYSARFELIEEAVRLSAAYRVPMALHLAESLEEIALLHRGSGPMAEFLLGVGAGNIIGSLVGRRPIDYLVAMQTAHRALVIHGNYLDADEIELLARHRAAMSIVYCPRSHAWFGHRPYPLDELLRRGVRVALGTDSRASSPDLDLWAEARRVLSAHGVGPGDVLRMATLWGAEALGVDDLWGSIAAGKRADLVSVALPTARAADPNELLFDPRAGSPHPVCSRA